MAPAKKARFLSASRRGMSMITPLRKTCSMFRLPRFPHTPVCRIGDIALHMPYHPGFYKCGSIRCSNGTGFRGISLIRPYGQVLFWYSPISPEEAFRGCSFKVRQTVISSRASRYALHSMPVFSARRVPEGCIEASKMENA
jgi:hypothetical protein